MAAQAQQKAAFRRWARANHPDVGGDPAVFSAGLQALREGRWSDFSTSALAADAPLDPPRPTVYARRSPRGVMGLVSVARRWNDRRRQPPRVR